MAAVAGSIAILGIVWTSPDLVAGQAPAATRARTSANVPRTADGKPDLHGVWAYGTLTPLERPGDVSGKTEFTDEEAEQFQKQARENRNQDRRDGAGTNADVSRAYNDFWWDFGRNVSGRQTSLVIDPPDGRIPALTPEAQQRAAALAEVRSRRTTAAEGPEDRSLWERCITRQLPTLPGPYNNNIQIIQTRDHVVIVNEMIHEARIIPLDGRPQGKLTRWHGDSRGRWEGDTLVVDSNGYTDRSWLDWDGHPHTEALRITERYTRRDFGRIDVNVSMVDPTAYPNGIRFTMPMKFRPDTELIEAFCENNTASLARMAKTAPAEVVNVPAATLSSHVGVYDLVDADGNKTVAAITVDGSTLALDYDGKGKEALLPLSPARFSWSGTIVEFAAGAGGAPEMVIHYAEGSERGPRR
jgi:hypothetical protein